MRPVRHGPDIPERLLQAHEERRVVFFCGAGISSAAGLPNFQGLVSQLYDKLNVTPNAVQQAAIKAGQFDTAIGLLEADILGGRESVRRMLADILTPDLNAPNATTTHQALLTLAKNREGKTRLITTNFDRLFEKTISDNNLAITRLRAPMLRVPNHSWDGLVYLHGLLSPAPILGELNDLILSSGDFGRAYLTERWAARFVSELFRNYSVCFVGYSINDPVLRYMMDALAADRLLGESPPEMFAFGSYSKGKEDDCTKKWMAKNVTPILYREHNRHAYLHKTLRAWAETYRDGVRGKERIVVECAMARPLASTKQDDFIGRMLWALSDPSGLPARRFADLDPVPSLDWLEPLSEERYGHADLNRFGVASMVTNDDELKFSLIRRPSAYAQAPSMVLVEEGATGGKWDKVMPHLAHWLTRHLDDPELVLWFAKRGGQLHSHLVWLIERRLDELARLERDGKTDELERIRTSAPNAIPRPAMRTLWRLLSAGRVKSPWRDQSLYRWKDRLSRDGLTVTLRLELRELLAPKVTLRKPFRWVGDGVEAAQPDRLKQLVDWELMLAADHVHSSLSDLARSDLWPGVLPMLVDDFQQLLRDALDLRRELGEADDLSDRSHWDMSSISVHWQNRRFRDWVALVELLRDGWLAVHLRDPARARHIAHGWLAQPYPTFRRLVLFAATHEGIADHGEWVDWLLARPGWWLWSAETQRETMRVLVLQGARLPDVARARLERAILAGPPREMFRSDMEPETFAQRTDDMVWLRLAKLESGGCSLGQDARAKLETLSAAYPEWQLADNQRDEFSHWMTRTGDPDYKSLRQIERTPRNRHDLVDWLQHVPQKRPFYENDWRETCRDRFFHCVFALCDLSRKKQWPAAYWREALHAWSDDKLLLRSWRYVAPLLQDIPPEVLHEISHSASWWLEAASKAIDLRDAVLIDLCRRVLALPHQDGVDADQSVEQAINHPVGLVAQALLNFWLRGEPSDAQGLPVDLNELFTQMCDTSVEHYRHGRVLLGSHVIALFRVDRAWTQDHLLPLFDWQSSAVEARAVWEGFLWSPRLYSPLMDAIKTSFLDTARHYADLGERGEQYADLLTSAALDSGNPFTISELASTTRALPAEGLRHAAQTLVVALESAGDQRADYWTNRVLPYLKKVWPKSRDRITPAISETLARLCIAAREKFPEAVEMLKYWLRPPEHPDYVIFQLHEAELCTKFPEPALAFLYLVAIRDNLSPPSNLQDCLDAIRMADPALGTDDRFQGLTEYLRRHGQE